MKMGAMFEWWVQTVFDHPVTEPEWYWDQEFESLWEALDLTDALTVRYLTRVFLEPELLKRYSLEQVAQGIWFLIGEASPGKQGYALISPRVVLGERVACIQAMAEFFRNFAAPAAPGPADTECDPFHGACFMWWDLLWHTFPMEGGVRGGGPELHWTCLQVMTEILDLPSELCQVSALHGLNHWHLQYASQVEQIVDAFLGKTIGLTPRVLDYASKVRLGLSM
jgi:hypothetical protein